MKFSNLERKQLANEVFSNLQKYVRDVNLSEAQEKLYNPGLILRDEALTFATPNIGKMETTCRFTFLASENNVTTLPDSDQSVVYLGDFGSHFKVLDVYAWEGKAQILLLLLPRDYRWKYFREEEFVEERSLIEEARASFEKEPFSGETNGIDQETWAHCIDAFGELVGVDLDNQYFETEVSVESMKFRVDYYSFRQTYHKFVYVEFEDLLADFMPEIDTEGATGLIVYGYIDESKGMCYQPVALATEHEYGFTTKPLDGEYMYVFSSNTFDERDYCALNYFEIDDSGFDAFEKRIKSSYDTKNPSLADIRNLEAIDLFRHTEYPDDCQVAIVKEGLLPELVWVRLDNHYEGTYFGELLNPPCQDYGLCLGDRIRARIEDIGPENPIGDLEGIMLVSRI